jgi:hypothetical protein
LPDRGRAATLVALALAAATSALSSAAAAQGCAASLTAQTVPAGNGEIAVQFTAPCAPYAAVILRYGALTVGEETDASGLLSLIIPRLPEVEAISIDLGADSLGAAVPPSEHSAPEVTAVIWPDGVRWGVLGAAGAESGLATQSVRPLTLGFPGRGPSTDLITGDAPVHLSVPISPETCGQTLVAQVLHGNLARPLAMTLPDCDGLGGTLHLPLPPPDIPSP